MSNRRQFVRRTAADEPTRQAMAIRRPLLGRLGDMGFPQNDVARVLPPMDELLP